MVLDVATGGSSQLCMSGAMGFLLFKITLMLTPLDHHWVILDNCQSYTRV